MSVSRPFNAVRLLTLDLAPRMQTWLNLVTWLAVGATTVAWMKVGGSPNIMIVFSASVATLTFAVKMPLWETLPVSRTERARAQWWYLWGRPYGVALVVTAVAAAVAIPMGWLHVGPMDVGAYLGGELTLLGLVGLTVPMAAGLRRLGVGGALVGFGLPFALAMGLGFSWNLNAAFSAARLEMIACGAMAVGIAVLAYLLSPWMPLAQPQLLRQPRQKIVAEISRSSVPAPSTVPPKTWALFLGLFRRAAMVLPFMGIVILAIIGLSLSGLRFIPVPLEDFLLFVPLVGAVTAITTVTTVSHRVLAGLPLTTWTRTLVLQAISPVLQVPLVALVVVTLTVARPQALSAGWLGEIGLAALGAMALTAVGLPMTLRFGRLAPSLMAGFVSGFAGAAIGGAVAATDHHLPGIYGVPMLYAVFGAGGFLCLVMAAGWLWTWLELSRGRAAYRQWTWQPVRWRGR
jgi:hypothetical protein